MGFIRPTIFPPFPGGVHFCYKLGKPIELSTRRKRKEKHSTLAPPRLLIKSFSGELLTIPSSNRYRLWNYVSPHGFSGFKVDFQRINTICDLQEQR